MVSCPARDWKKWTVGTGQFIGSGNIYIIVRHGFSITNKNEIKFVVRVKNCQPFNSIGEQQSGMMERNVCQSHFLVDTWMLVTLIFKA